MHWLLDARTVNDHFPGIGRYTFNLARAMKPLLAADEELVLLRDPRQPSVWDLNELSGSPVRIIDLPVSPFELRQQSLLPHRLRELQVDLYHSPYYLMPYRPGLPTVVTLHDLIPHRYPQYFTPGQRLIFALTIRLAMATAATTIAVSQATAHDLIRLWLRPKIRPVIIPEAPDTTFCPQPPDRVASLRDRFDLPQQYVLYLGSNKPHKNLVRLVDSWGRLPKPAMPLVIAGFWDERFPEARQLAEKLSVGDSIRFLGPIGEADVPALYSGAYFFVFPSEYEGWGLPVLEAMACGAAVACSNRSSLPEVAGEAALLFDPLDVHAIAAALHRFLSDPALTAAYREKSLRRAAEFTWQDTAARTLELYRRYTGGSNL